MTKLKIAKNPVEELLDACENTINHGGRNVMGDKIYSLPSRLRTRLTKALNAVRKNTCEECFSIIDEELSLCIGCGNEVCSRCLVSGLDEPACVNCY